MMKIEGSGSGSICQRHGSADPDPHQNVMDLEHWTQPFKVDQIQHVLRRKKYGHKWNKYHSFTPMKYCHKNRLSLAGKIWFDFPSCHIFPSTPPVKVEQSLHGLSGKKRQRGKEHHIFSPSWIFVLFLAWHLLRGKNMILFFRLSSFFPKFPIILWSIVLALSFSHFSIIFPCLLFLILFFCQHVYDIFSPSDHIY
jgi:hypothetical protein